jgi:putative spermidine/putrescine transport system ATP-binding protein
VNSKMKSVAVCLSGVSKRFGDVVAVDNVDLEIADGEFFAMLGPSGSGKTTVLRMIAGFERPDSGRIELAGQDVTDQPPFLRDVNTVFQDYALFPHMNVLANIEYGLRVKGVGKDERVARAEKALARVRLPGLGGRKPSQLSGGQRQRVALARALVNEPKVLLLDEPLGALDLKLRQEMQVELKALQREVGITFIFVTHDQEEALTMADRIAVFNRGRIEQMGNALDVYEYPQSEFVAGFVGTSNLLQAEVSERVIGKQGTFSIRPEKISIVSSTTTPVVGDRRVSGTVTSAVYLGAATRITVALQGGGTLITLHHNDGGPLDLAIGSPIELAWDSSMEFQVT